MEYGVYHDLHPPHLEEDAVREPPEQGSPHRAVDELMSFRWRRMDASEMLTARRKSRARRRLCV